jgi:hypothetical protein
MSYEKYFNSVARAFRVYRIDRVSRLTTEISSWFCRALLFGAADRNTAESKSEPVLKNYVIEQCKNIILCSPVRSHTKSYCGSGSYTIITSQDFSN